MKRELSLDLARGFTVLAIAPIHTVMLYSRPSVHESWLGNLLRLVAEWPGAQVLMFIMGTSFALQKNVSSSGVLKKAFWLLLVAYGLNVAKFVLPAGLGLLPNEFLLELQPDKAQPLLSLFLVGDILHFAVLALISLLVLKRLPATWTLLLLVLFMFGSVAVWDLRSGSPFFAYQLQLLGGEAPRVFFPLAPWLVYPLAGSLIGGLMKQGYLVRQPLLLSGAFLFCAQSLLRLTPFHFPQTSFYRTYPDATMQHLGFSMLWIAGWMYASNIRENALFRLLLHYSRNITAIYVVQWVVIFWLLPVMGYQRLGLVPSILMVIVVSWVVFRIVYLWGVIRLSLSPFGIAPKGDQKV